MEEEVRGRRGVSSPAPRPILLILIVVEGLTVLEQVFFKYFIQRKIKIKN